MADPVVHITAGVPDSGTGNITTLGQTLLDGANATMGAQADAAVAAGAAGTLSAKLRAISRDVGTLVTNFGAALTRGAGAADTNTQRVTIDSAQISAVGTQLSAASVSVVLASDAPAQRVSQDTNTILNGNTALTPAFAKIVASSSGATTIVALTAGKKIRVLAWDLKVNAAVNFKWQSHVTPTDLTGLYYNGAQGDGVARAFNPLGYFETIAGEALDLNLSGAVAVGGVLTYVLV